MRQKLVIISHTEHYLKDNKAVGWGSTVTEINYLSQYWKEVVHIACLHPQVAPPSSLPYTEDNIRFEAIPPFGGETWKDKLSILFKMPKILRTIQKELRGATEVQLRLPTGIGVFLLPWFSFQRRPYSFWVKYAGNWVQEKPPLGYGFQRWWLKKNFARTKVTINGKWPNQPTHCLSFENPCLWRNEVSSAKSIVTEKRFKPPYRLLFVGQLRPGKGVDRIMEALKGVNHKLVSQVDFAGDGANMPHYISLSKDLDCKCNFLGFQSRENVHQLMQSAHFLLLPSDSEGFPKVVAEGACYGAIPIVSNISCISHYITADKGFLWETDSSFAQLMLSVLSTSPKELESKSRELNKLSLSFTFEHYYEMLCKRVLS